MKKVELLYQYQRDGIEALTSFLFNNPDKSALLADPPGAGKTPQAIGVAESVTAKTVLVICPASLKENWRREFLRWSDHFEKVCNVISSSDIIPSDAEVIVVSYTMSINAAILEQLMNRRFDVMILDEAHYCKNPKSQTSRIVLCMLWARCRYRLALTGTPLPNGRAAEAWTLFSRLSQTDFGSWNTFKDRYCVEEETRWGVTYPRSKNLEELRKIASEKFMLRRSKDVVLSQLPGLIRQNVYLKLPELQVLKSEAGIDVDAIVEAVDKGLPLDSDHITTLRRKVGSLKAPHALSYLTELLDEVEQVVVFVHHREVYELIQQGLEALDIAVVGINGMTPPEERQKFVDDFQNKKAQVFLASIKAANTGLTLTSAHTLVMVEYDWVPSTNEQAEGRIYRVSQKEIARVIYLVVADSLDEKVLRVVQRKQRDITKALGD